MTTVKSVTRWGVLFRSENRLDGKREHICFENCLPVLFTTRENARAYIKQRYGYIARRQDLQREPHGLKMPIPVRVRIEVAR